MATYAKFFSLGGGAGSDGTLQVQGGLPLSTSLQRIEDQVSNLSNLYLATDKTAIDGTLKIGGVSATESSAILQIDSLTQGLLFPRLTEAQRDAIVSPVAGLTIYNTDTNQLNTYNGSAWVPGGFLYLDEIYDNTVQETIGITPKPAYTNANLALVPNGTGAIVAQVPDGTNTGGNARGAYAVDLQTTTNLADRVASGDYSVISGGRRGKASGLFSTIGGGDTNFSTSNYTTTSGGASNLVSSNYSTVSGGESNTVSSGTHATVVGGKSNTSTGQYSVSGGYSNVASGQGGVALGYNNTVIDGIAIGYGNEARDYYSFAGGYNNTARGSNSTAFGYQNDATGGSSVVSGGYDNSATSTYATVVGGRGNTSNGNYSVSGGRNTTASNYGSVAIGIQSLASGHNSIALSGGTASGTRSVLVGRGTSQGDGSVSIGSYNNAIAGRSVAIGDGNNATAGGATAIGTGSIAYLRGQFAIGYNLYLDTPTGLQCSIVMSKKQDTLSTGGTTVLSLDGTGTTNLIIPDGNNRLWSAKITATAFVSANSGTTLVNGDSYMAEYTVLFKKVSGTSSVVGTNAGNIIHDTNMAGATFTFAAGASQDLQITFNAPTAASADTFRCVAKVELVETAF